MHACRWTDKQTKQDKQTEHRTQDKKGGKKSPIHANGWEYKGIHKVSTTKKGSSLTVLLVQADQILLGHIGGFSEIDLTMLALSAGGLHGFGFITNGVDTMRVLGCG